MRSIGGRIALCDFCGSQIGAIGKAPNEPAVWSNLHLDIGMSLSTLAPTEYSILVSGMIFVVPVAVLTDVELWTFERTHQEESHALPDDAIVSSHKSILYTMECI